MTTAETLMLVAVFVLISAAAILAMAETALTRINRIKAMTLAEEKRRGSHALVRLVEHPRRARQLRR